MGASAAPRNPARAQGMSTKESPQPALHRESPRAGARCPAGAPATTDRGATPPRFTRAASEKSTRASVTSATHVDRCGLDVDGDRPPIGVAQHVAGAREQQGTGDVSSSKRAREDGPPQDQQPDDHDGRLGHGLGPPARELAHLRAGAAPDRRSQLGHRSPVACQPMLPRVDGRDRRWSARRSDGGGEAYVCCRPSRWWIAQEACARHGSAPRSPRRNDARADSATITGELLPIADSPPPGR